MPSGRNRILLYLGLLAGLFLVSGIALAVLSLRSGMTDPGASGWTVPVLAGMVIGVAALLLSERPKEGDHDPQPRSSPCAACGNPIIDEWRLCPHCGELLECDMSLPVEGGPFRG